VSPLFAPPHAGDPKVTREVMALSSVPLELDQRCRVRGVLHSYLGEIRLDAGGELIHVFLRCEWRPNTPGQLRLTLVWNSPASPDT
jgi:hypothetical protein